MTSELGARDQSRCEAMNARGERCGKRAQRGRFCLTHAGVQNMKELGRKGGRARPNTKLRASVDDELREKARAALEQALDGDDEKRRFEAAKSLFSYRAAVPPVEQQAREQQAGRMVYSVVDLVETAGELRIFSQIGGMDETSERALVERLKARHAHDQADTPTPTHSAAIETPPPVPGNPSPSGKSNGSEPPPFPSDAPGAGYEESQEAVNARRHGSPTAKQLADARESARIEYTAQAQHVIRTGAVRP